MTVSSDNRDRRPRHGLHALEKVDLAPREESFLRDSIAHAAGDPTWKRRKLREAHDLFALAQIAPRRLSVQMLDPRDDLRAIVTLRAPVPCLEDPQGELQIADEATLGLTYPRAILSGPLPGYAVVQVLAPLDVWHANVGRTPSPQSLCLAAKLPQGTRLPQIIVLAYAALSMQIVMVDEGDAAGVLNADAARWWQRNLALAPLTREPFLSEEVLDRSTAEEVAP